MIVGDQGALSGAPTVPPSGPHPLALPWLPSNPPPCVVTPLRRHAGDAVAAVSVQRPGYAGAASARQRDGRVPGRRE